MKFDYLKITLPEKSTYFGNNVLRPIIPVQIVNKYKGAKYGALIDSGADFCIFDAEIGEYLDIDIKSGNQESFGGIQEKSGAIAFLHSVTLNVGGWDYVTTIGFSYDIAKHGIGILGQKGFFELFSVMFDYKKERIELKPR